jgi:hypothetical protein
MDYVHSGLFAVWTRCFYQGLHRIKPVFVIQPLNSKGGFMPSNNSPLESLAAFAIVFVAGAVSILGFNMYIEKVKRDTRRTT